MAARISEEEAGFHWPSDASTDQPTELEVATRKQQIQKSRLPRRPARSNNSTINSKGHHKQALSPPTRHHSRSPIPIWLRNMEQIMKGQKLSSGLRGFRERSGLGSLAQRLDYQDEMNRRKDRTAELEKELDEERAEAARLRQELIDGDQEVLGEKEHRFREKLFRLRLSRSSFPVDLVRLHDEIQAYSSSSEEDSDSSYSLPPNHEVALSQHLERKARRRRKRAAAANRDVGGRSSSRSAGDDRGKDVAGASRSVTEDSDADSLVDRDALQALKERGSGQCEAFPLNSPTIRADVEMQDAANVSPHLLHAGEGMEIDEPAQDRDVRDGVPVVYEEHPLPLDQNQAIALEREDARQAVLEDFQPESDEETDELQSLRTEPQALCAQDQGNLDLATGAEEVDDVMRYVLTQSTGTPNKSQSRIAEAVQSNSEPAANPQSSTDESSAIQIFREAAISAAVADPHTSCSSRLQTAFEDDSPTNSPQEAEVLQPTGDANLQAISQHSADPFNNSAAALPRNIRNNPASSGPNAVRPFSFPNLDEAENLLDDESLLTLADKESQAWNLLDGR